MRTVSGYAYLRPFHAPGTDKPCVYEDIIIHPTTEDAEQHPLPMSTLFRVSLEQHVDEYFQVERRIPRGNGRLLSEAAGGYLQYADAYLAAQGLGVNGGMGLIRLMAPYREPVVVTAKGGVDYKIGDRTGWDRLSLGARLTVGDRVRSAA